MGHLCRNLVRCFLVTALAVFSITGKPQAAELGKTITNIASIGYSETGGRSLNVVTNPAVLVVEARRTESTIEFFRYAPSLTGAFHEQINGSDYAPGGQQSGPFTPIGAPVNPGGQQIDISSPVPLAPATAYSTGEVMFVRVTDLGQNGDPARIETVSITVTASTGDEITLRLYETGPDTGEFWAYVPSVRALTPTNDPQLTTSAASRLTATYVDAFDSTEVSVDTALVDPFGRVFNALTGELIDGVTVSIYNSDTGALAEVFGIDGVSRYPNVVVTGQDTTDAGGFTYDIEPGEFRFPLMAPGNYEVRVELPPRLSLSSITDPAAFDGFAGAPFTIVPASFGRSFELDGLGPINFDIPLDAETDLVVTKLAEPSIGDVGDYIRYAISLDNTGSSRVPVTLKDIMPAGFRYVPGSSRVGELSTQMGALADPVISSDGSTFSYDMGPVAPGGSVTVSYVMQIGAGVQPGDAVNAAMAVNGAGSAISNVARAPVTIREDLFRSKTTIIGRVAEQACNGDEEWAKELRDGIGIEGVRVYLETGTYAVTDRDGLYHFEGISEGTHVVQLDKETLPTGYEPMVCEENSRYAWRSTSKFIEVRGGNIWRANFYLKRTGDLAADVTEEGFRDQVEYKDFDTEWLETQDATADWAYPSPARTPSQPSINIGIKHSPDQWVTIERDGRAVPKENFVSRDSDLKRTVMMSRWRGVDLSPGRNVFVATLKTEDGRTVDTLTREIWFVTEASRAIPVVDQSVLIADGRTTPVLAVRMEDVTGRPVHAGRELSVDVASPYRLEIVDDRENANELVSPLSARGGIAVGADGIARIRLEPTLQTGRVNVLVNLDDGRQVPIEMYLKPEKRDWIIVGLAEGTIGYETIKGNAEGSDSDDVFTDGRVAFFAKGVIKGEWLLTLQVDTDKSRKDRDGDFVEEIDPNAYYTLYGDRTYQELETPSRYPVYVKLERNQFYAMFGDYDTNIIDGKLTQYTRRLSGVKTEYVGEDFRVVAFGAESNQGFAKDEIAADGTSGSYRLSNAPVLNNSETIEIETRDRFRSDIVLERRKLIRHVDYTLDYLTGELIFRLPVPVSDPSFNPNVIVVDYETTLDAERNFTYGARVSGDLLDGRVTVGGAYIHEGGDRSAANSKKEVAGLDVVARLGEGTEARVEVARSRSDLDGVETDANAYLAEITHRSATWAAELYVRQEDEGFGLGQQSSGTAGARRIGGNATVELSRTQDEESGRVTTWSASVEAYHEKNLVTGSTRILGDAEITRESGRYGVSTGIRHVQDEIIGGTDKRSTLATASGRVTIPEWGATVSVAHEQPLTSENTVTEFPQRTTLSVSKTINRWATATVTHEYKDGEDIEAHTTSAGLQIKPWTGAAITLGTDMMTADSARRLGATVGIDQQVKLSENWTGSVGLTNHTVLEGSGDLAQIVADDAISPVELGEDYTAAYVGAGYRSQWTSASVRAETRLSEDNDTHTASAAISRELSQELSVAGSARAQMVEAHARPIGEHDELRADMKLGVAWRPRVEGPVVLNRLDLKFDRSRFGDTTSKIVNNLAANTYIGDRTQVAGHYGVKYVRSDFGGTAYSGWTHLLGAEARFDVTKHIDLGIHGSILYTPDSGTKEYAWGPSIGVSPVDNLWISLGYNFTGFDDEDFEAARYSRHGLYLKLRLKFDEDTARNILDMISPYAE